MTPEARDITVQDWPAVKALWFAVLNADEPTRAALLNDAAVLPNVKQQVASMLAAASRVGERFEQTAMKSLGITPAADGPVPTLIGQRLGPYEVVRRIGQGGMGAVYEAVRADDVYRIRVAIKTIWRGADSDVLLQRFRSERQILAGLQHPNIAGLIDGGATVQGTPWLALEFVDGIAIDAYCDQHQLALPARLDLFQQVCAAVQYAHSRLVIHRDLKPNNVLVTDDGTVKLLDFGVSKLLDGADDGTLTSAGLSPFTAAYAAPEQAEGTPISTATDVYSLGALLVTLLAGEPPVNMHELGPAARLDAVRNASPRAPSAIASAAPPSLHHAEGSGNGTTHPAPHAARRFATARQLTNALHGELDAIALMALRREPERRYSSAQALSEDVRRYLKRERVLARPDTFAYRVQSTVRRQPALVAASLTALLVVVGGSLFALNQARAIRAEAARSERVGAFMAGMVGGPNASTSDLVIRIGPQGTVADLLDSALARVPSEFANDKRTRARLYTAIGVNYAGQARYNAAHFVLDSAAVLSREAYGANSPQYAKSLLELAAVEQALSGPDGATVIMQTIERVVSGSPIDTGAIRANRLSVVAEGLLTTGFIKAADSVAILIGTSETARGQQSMTRARADLVVIKASSWLRRDPREYVRRCRNLLALTDSMNAQLTSESVYAAGCLVHGLVVLGRTDEAERVLNERMPRLQQNFGNIPLFAATLTAERAVVAAARGDSAARHAGVATAWQLVAGRPDVPLSDQTSLWLLYMDDAWSRGAEADALRVAEQLAERMSNTGAAMYSVYAQLYLGIARLRAKDWTGAEQALRVGIAMLPASRDLDSMLPRLRRPLVEALMQQKRTHEADSIRVLDPAPAAVPPCTPGGDWRGCVDAK
ncbi:MAG: serine/threonine-protein kinase [Gemmatimonadaceae bacterium]